MPILYANGLLLVVLFTFMIILEYVAFYGEELPVKVRKLDRQICSLPAPLNPGPKILRPEMTHVVMEW